MTPPDDLAEIQVGKTIRQIAQVYGVSPTTAYRWIKKAGIQYERKYKFIPVRMITKTGEVREYPSIKEAAEHEYISPSSICAVLRGRYKTAGGCRWEYAEVRDKP